MLVTANKLKSQAAGKMGYETSDVGDLVTEALEAAEPKELDLCLMATPQLLSLA